jgi:hypothetical protein
MPKGTTSKETVETRSYGKKLFFTVKFPEFLGSTSCVINVTWYKQSQKVRCEQSTVIIMPMKPYSVSLQLLSGLSQ